MEVVALLEVGEPLSGHLLAGYADVHLLVGHNDSRILSSRTIDAHFTLVPYLLDVMSLEGGSHLRVLELNVVLII